MSGAADQGARLQRVMQATDSRRTFDSATHIGIAQWFVAGGRGITTSVMLGAFALNANNTIDHAPAPRWSTPT
jgi:hypothetical protein